MKSKPNLLRMVVLFTTLLAACSPKVEPVATATSTIPAPAFTLSPTQTVSPSATATIPRTPTVTKQPSPTAKVAPPTTPAECAAGWTRLAGVEYAAVMPGYANRVRAIPDTVGDILSQLNPGMMFKILEGPVCADGFAFWRVEHASIPGGSGWTAEGDLAEYFLEPVERVDCSGHGVSFLMPASWDCEGQIASAGTNEYGHSWPKHIHIIFTAYPAFSEGLPGIYVYPTADLPASFVGPVFGAPLMVRAHVKELSLGERGVSENGNIHPVFNSRLLYYYEGKTADGKHTLIAVLPVNAPFLPNSYDDPSLPVNGIPFDMVNLSFDWSAYYGKVQAQLESAPETAFTPTLEMLDALVESILVK